MNFLIRLIITALAAMLAAYLLPGVHIQDFITALLFALVLALLNVLVKPILIIFTLPATILTLGFFLLVINAVIILLASSIVKGFKVDGFWWAMLFSIVLTIIAGLMNRLGRQSDKE